MTQPVLDFFKKRALLIKAEPSEGTDAAPVGSIDGFRLFDGASSTEYDKVERNIDTDAFGAQPFSIGNKRSKIEGNFELYPPATPGAASTSDATAAKILLPAGMAVTKDAIGKTTTYNPISAAIPTVTAYFGHSGTRIKSLGARADISGLMIQIGNRFMGKASITGTYAAVDTTTLGTVTLDSIVPVVARFANTTTLLSTLIKGATAATSGTPLSALNVWAKSLSVDFGNALSHKEYTSHAENGISDRQAKWSLRIAKTDIMADFNPWFVRDNGTILTVALSLFDDDTQDGLFSKLYVRGQIDTIAESDIDGDYGWDISGPCIPSSTGNDEFYVQFGNAAP